MKVGNTRVKRVLAALAFLLIGLSLQGSSCSLTGHADPGVLLGRANNRSTPVWSKDGSQIVFAHVPSGVFVVDTRGSTMWSLPPGSPIGTVRAPGSLSPALSPDGSRVAYATVRRGDWSNNYYSDIVSSAIDGSRPRRLTNDNSMNMHPAWSPDGSRVAFVSDRSSQIPALHIYVMDSDGSKVRSLAPSIRSMGQPPVWSPDGSRIAFVAYRSERKGTAKYDRRYIVYTVRPDGMGLTELGDTASNVGWSPDGSRVAFIRIAGWPHGPYTNGLYTVGADGADPRMLLPFDHGLGFNWYDSMTWSPDGSEILYGRSGYFTLVAVDAAGAKATIVATFPLIWEDSLGAYIEGGDDVTPTPVTDYPPVRPRRDGTGGAAWSPDGSRIAFHVNREYSDAVLYTTARDGSDRRIVVKQGDERLIAED